MRGIADTVAVDDWPLADHGRVLDAGRASGELDAPAQCRPVDIWLCAGALFHSAGGRPGGGLVVGGGFEDCLGKVLQLGVPVVTAFHVTRLAAVLLLTEPLYRWFYQSRI